MEKGKHLTPAEQWERATLTNDCAVPRLYGNL